MELTNFDRNQVHKVLVINGSPNRNRSNTLVVTNAFLEGLNEDKKLDVEIVNVSDLKITPCLGCLSCWGKTAGECVIKNDDVLPLKNKILAADIILVSYPLYFFSMPGVMKLLTDRLLSMMETYAGQKAPENGQSFHGLRYFNPKQRFVLISTCAYTEAKAAYQSLLLQHDAICGKGNYTPILVPQMKTLKDLHNEAKLNRYLAKFVSAGKMFREKGTLTQEELDVLSKPPFTEGAYKIFLNNFWEEERNKGKQ